MFRAKLVDLVVQLVGYPVFLVVLSIVKHGLVYVFFAEFVDHLYLVEVDQSAI